MFCTGCGNKIDPKAKFCPHCGTPVPENIRAAAEEAAEKTGETLSDLGDKAEKAVKDDVAIAAQQLREAADAIDEAIGTKADAMGKAADEMFGAGKAENVREAAPDLQTDTREKTDWQAQAETDGQTQQESSWQQSAQTDWQAQPGGNAGYSGGGYGGGYDGYTQNYAPVPTGNYTVITERSIILSIVLYFVTCGFYGYYWMYKLNEEINSLSDTPSGTSGGMVILFSILSCGIYYYYWLYRMGERVDIIKSRGAYPSSNSGILYLILGFFGLGIVDMALMQDCVNNAMHM